MHLLSFALLLPLAAPAPTSTLPMPPPPAGMHALATTDARALPMPAPPQGMHPLGPAEAAQKLQTQTDATDAASDDDDAPSDGTDELSQMEAAEKAAIPQDGDDAADPATALGIANPLRARLEDGLEDFSLREDRSPLDLAPVKDLKHFDVSQVAGEYDIPVEMQPLVAQYIRFFQGPGRTWFRHWMERSHRYIPVMRPILEKAGLPGDTVYLAMIESGFATDAHSWAHAVGPWQFIAATGKHFGLREDFWVDERRDPIASTVAAAKYLRQLHDELGDWYLAWAAYNTGGGRIRRLTARRGTNDFWELSEGKGLALETKHYVPKLIACALVAKHPDAFGFNSAEFRWQDVMRFDEVKLVDPTDLSVIARAAGTSVKEIEALNPGLKRWCTPPATADHPFVLRVPTGTGEVLAQNLARMPARKRLTYRVYTVHAGDTVGGIAHRFHTATEAILTMNHLASARRLRLHAELVIPVPQSGPRPLPTLVASHTASPDEQTPSVSRQVVAKALAQARTPHTAQALTRMRDPDVELASQKRANVELVSQKRTDVELASQKRAETEPRTEELTADDVASSAVARPLPAAQGKVLAESVDGRTRLTYVVCEGDTLWSISQRFGCSVDDVRKWNHLHRRGQLQSGVSLVLWPKAHVVSSRGAARPWVAQSSLP